MCLPLLVFGPSWFLAPPAAKSWRRAWAGLWPWSGLRGGRVSEKKAMH